MRGATYSVHDKSYLQAISIHAPHARCDRGLLYSLYVCPISIHAPHARCDIIRSKATNRKIIFQSTHPMRGATLSTAFCFRLCLFQSTHPMRGATMKPTNIKENTIISIHAPHARCDSMFRCHAQFH